MLLSLPVSKEAPDNVSRVKAARPLCRPASTPTPRLRRRLPCFGRRPRTKGWWKGKDGAWKELGKEAPERGARNSAARAWGALSPSPERALRCARRATHRHQRRLLLPLRHRRRPDAVRQVRPVVPHALPRPSDGDAARGRLVLPGAHGPAQPRQGPRHAGRRRRAGAAQRRRRDAAKPPRVDASRYQVAPRRKLAGAARSAERARRAAGSCMWCPARIDDDDLLELLGFARRLAHNRFRSDAFFNELVMTHLHLCDYNRVVAGHALLRASEKLAALPTAAWEELQADGHAEGDVIVALLRDAHGAARLMRGAPPGMLAVSLPAAARGATLAALEPEPEPEPEAAHRSRGRRVGGAPRHPAWDLRGGAAAAATAVARLEQLQKLLADGAGARRRSRVRPRTLVASPPACPEVRRRIVGTRCAVGVSAHGADGAARSAWLRFANRASRCRWSRCASCCAVLHEARRRGRGRSPKDVARQVLCARSTCCTRTPRLWASRCPPRTRRPLRRASAPAKWMGIVNNHVSAATFRMTRSRPSPPPTAASADVRARGWDADARPAA